MPEYTIVGSECPPIEYWYGESYPCIGMHKCINMPSGFELALPKTQMLGIATWALVGAEIFVPVRFCAWCGMRLPYPEGRENA